MQEFSELFLGTLRRCIGCQIATLLVVAFHLFGINPGWGDETNCACASYESGKLVAHLDCPAIRESSGLASSRRHEDLLWTHNDSGSEPQIFAFDVEGQHLGRVRIEGARAIDWEDMASFELDGKPWLLLADTGDNKQARSTYQLYLLQEPEHSSTAASVDHVIDFTYEGGSFDCEAVAVDPTSRQILLVSKDWTFTCKLFSLPLPDGETPLDSQIDTNGTSGASPRVARHVADLKLPGVTALDISPDGRRAVALTYAHAYEYQRKADEDWTIAFSREGREIQLPPRKQSEAICFGANGKTLYCTSEACPAPLFCVEVALGPEENRDPQP